MEEIDVLGMLEDHEGRLVKLEKSWGKIDDVEKRVLSVENTVLKSSGEQKDLLNKLIDHHLTTQLKKEEHDMTAQLKKEDNVYTAESKKEDRKHEIRKSKITMWATVVTATFSSGGIILLVINWLLTR